ncbi:MAG TPA: GTP 3',8-cyclase MoaA [Polyangiaceae bacterium]|nr:GTP 3',8-cyclase MoaA [Polyangiaceae bacterium]
MPSDRPEDLTDRLGRGLRDLRLSVTDRCNFRCGYCMPREHFGPEHPFMPRQELLTFEELQRVARSAAALGVKKLRLTGGEPLLRKDLHVLVGLLRDISGVELSLTTNGSLLAKQAEGLARAGLDRVTVSLDALEPDLFRRIADADFDVTDVLSGIEAAQAAGLAPIKINCVVQKGLNDSQIVPLARRFRGTGHVLRFIEFMDVGITNGWRLDRVLSGKEILERIAAEIPLEPVPDSEGVATRYRYVDGSGEVGVITSVTRPFCSTCSRLRLSSDGKLFTCLFGNNGVDLRAVLRRGGTDDEIIELMRASWVAREDRYSELRSSRTRSLPRIEMSYIGG